MKIRASRLITFTLISLLWLFASAADAGAQDNTFNQQTGSPELHGKAGNIHKANMAAPASSYTYKVLYKFKYCPDGGPWTDGCEPFAGLFRDAAGNLYGTTFAGGVDHDSGTVYKLDTAGHETVLYSFTFCSAGCTDGYEPRAGLIQDAAGNLYGTTFLGDGNTNSVCFDSTGLNCGTVFKLDSTGHETVLYNFCSESNCADGANPYAGLIQDTAGNLYGTTGYGGANKYGTVFKIDNTGHETVLYSFCSAANCTDGSIPLAGLFRDTAGNLYGTTGGGGANNGGTVFKLDSTGHETVLYNFCSASGCTDGNEPYAGLIQDAAGNFYGTTAHGGNSGSNCLYGTFGCGTVFKLDSTGHETVLYAFCSASGCTDGGFPLGGLIQDAAGNLYGTTNFGGNSNSICGTSGCGTIFKVDTTSHETVLYSFCSVSKCGDGDYPEAGLIQDAAGNLYGTTGGGGNRAGVVFKLAAGAQGTAAVTLTSSPNPSYVDESVTLSAVVSGSGATPTGSVTFKEGTTVLGTETLTGGKASLPTTFTKSGTASIIASYSGDANYKAANSNTLKQVVKQYPTSTALVSSLNPSTYGQAVTLTATVSSAGPTPTGKVTFKNGSTSLGSATLSSGVAKITTSTLAVGTLSITASYAGDAANAKSTSPALKQVVAKATSKTVIVSSVNPSKVGQTVKFTATVTSPTTAPTGTVTFMDGSTTLGTGTIAKATGKASYSTKTLSAGSHNITAVYGGTADISGSTSPVLVQNVN